MGAALVVTSIAVTSPGAPPGIAAADGGSSRAEHVVLIGFDGFDPDYLDRVATPNIDALAARGAIGVTQGIMPPITNPSFTSLTTGAWPDRHGNRAYWWDQTANQYRGQSRANDVTSIAEAVRDAGGTVGAAQYFILQGNGADYATPGAVYTQPGGPCSRRFDDAIAMLHQEPVMSNGVSVPVDEIPTLLAVYCDDLDSIGHDEGADSPNLITALAELDTQVGRLVAAIDEVGLTDATTVVLTGDHGMSTYTQSFAVPLAQTLISAGYSPQFLFTAGQSVSASTDVVLISTGRSLSLYLTGARAGDADALDEIRGLAEAQPGTADILDRDAQRALHVHPDYGDLLIESEPGWGASILPPSGPQGDHGSSAETDAVFVIAGAGVAQAPASVVVRHIDVSPTIAELLGLPPLPDADGAAVVSLLTAEEPPATTTTTTPTSSTTTPTSTSSTPPGSTSSTTTPGSATTAGTSTGPAVGAAVGAAPVRSGPTYTG